MAGSKKLSFSKSSTLNFFLWKFHGLVLGLVGLIDGKPYRLSHINALRINQSYQPKDQFMKFSQKLFENWSFWKTQFLSRPFWNFNLKKKNLFLLHPYENQSKLIGYQGWVEISMITLIYSKRVSVHNNLLHSE